MFATDTIQCSGRRHKTIDEAFLTEYTIHRTLATNSIDDSLPCTINRVVDVLLQTTGQQESYDLRRTYIATLCKASVAHIPRRGLFEAMEPTFQDPESVDPENEYFKNDFRRNGGTDHVVIAATILNISPVVDAYLSLRVNLHPSSHYFGQALAAAISQGHLLMTEKCLAHGMKYLDNLDSNWTDPLECAARAGHEKLVHLLLSSRITNWRDGALYGAAQGGHLALLTSLFKDTKILGDSVVTIVLKIIFYGAEYGHLDVVRLGLRIGESGSISANPRFDEFSNFNRVASLNGSPDIIAIALQDRAHLRKWGLRKSLAKAASGGFTTIVQMLLDVGLDINKDCSGKYDPPAPLEAAAGAGRAETVRFLLNRYASIQGNLGLRAVTAAAKRGWLGVMGMLCDEGIELAGTEQNMLASNPMLTAMKYKQAHIIEFLLQKDVARIDRSSIDPWYGELKSNTANANSVVDEDFWKVRRR